jgi:glycosyltransferase involved in cell wall biosynthesis
MPVAVSSPIEQSRHLVILSQVYVPDPAAVGQYMADVADEFAQRGWMVTVYTSARGYDNPQVRYPSREERNGVSVRRLPFSSFGKRSIAIRLFGQALFLLQALLHALFCKRITAILASTSPPFAGFVATILGCLRGAPVVWWVMDLNPDQMVAAGRARAGSLAVRAFDWMNRFTLARASLVIALDDFMRIRLVAKKPVAEKIRVLPLWAQTTAAEADTAQAAAFRSTHGLDGRFVVMYSGNHSVHNPLATLLEAAHRLVTDDRVCFLFVGGGEGKREVHAAQARGCSNIVSLPYLPREFLATALSVADLHVVAIGDAMVGIVHPSKIYSAIAAQRPILSFGPDACDAAEVLRNDRIGWHVRHGDVDGACAAIQEAASLTPTALAAIGRRAAEVATARFSRGQVLTDFCALVERAAC